MFYYFFKEYKEICWKKKKLNVKQLVFLIVYILTSVMFIILTWINIHDVVNIYTILCFIAFLLEIIIIMIKTKKCIRLDTISAAERYRREKIDKIIEIMNISIFNFYSQDGVNWLIECCNREIKHSCLKKINGERFITVIVSLFGVLSYNENIDNQIYILLSFSFIIVLLLGAIQILLYAMEDVFYPDKIKYKSLKSDLEYIKINIEKPIVS